MGLKKARRRTVAIQTVFLTLFAIVVGLPIYIALVNGFKPSAEILGSPMSVPIPPVLENLGKVINNQSYSLMEMYGNSVALLFGAMVICMFVSALASYYMARANNKTANFLSSYFMLGLMVPYVIVYIPLSIMLRKLGIGYNLPVLILVFVSGNISFATFMYTSFIKSLPLELEESASMDGASRWRSVWSILFPLLKPCTATVCIFVGLGVWNDFQTPLLLGQIRTITVGIYTAIGPHSADWGLIFAYVLFASVPVIIAYLCAQNQFIDGLTAGATKG